MQSVDAELVERIDDYIEQLFVGHDDALTRNIATSRASGLPEIQVSPAEGKLLYLLAKIAGARRVLEIGTLGGYSTTWLARALPDDGAVVSLEVNETHAAVARRNLEDAHVQSKVSILVGDAADGLRSMIDRHEPAFDLVFIDADKQSYSKYLDLALRLSRPGTIILADNLLRHGAVLDAAPADENAAGARAYNALIAAHPRLESLVVPIIRSKIDGLSISRVTDAPGLG